MKYLFIILIFVFISKNNVFAKFCEKNNMIFKTKKQIIFFENILIKTDRFKIIKKSEKKETTWYETVATVTTDLLPETTYAICLISVRSIYVCNAILVASKVLVEMSNDEIKHGVTDGIKWVVEKGLHKSTIKIITDNYSIAKNSLDVFEKYKLKEIINWSNVFIQSKTNCICEDLIPYCIYEPDLDKVNISGYGIQLFSDADYNKTIEKIMNYEKLNFGKIYIRVKIINKIRWYTAVAFSYKNKKNVYKKIKYIKNKYKNDKHLKGVFVIDYNSKK